MLAILKKRLKKNKYLRFFYFQGKNFLCKWKRPGIKDLDCKLSQINNKLDTLNSLSVDNASKDKLLKEIQNDKERLAFVTILPPDDSGIAVIGLYSFLESKDEIDIFCPPVDFESYILNSRIIEKNNNLRLYNQKDLVLAAKLFSYKKIIIAIGNSSHHFYIIPLLRRLKTEHLEDKVVLYVHDVYLWNILFDGQNHTCSSFRKEISEIYGNIKLTSVDDKWTLQKELVHKYSLCGFKVFQKKFGIQNVLTNSEIAARLIKKDLSNDSALISFNKIFLPLVTKFTHEAKPVTKNLIEEKLANFSYIGSFGVLSDEKRTDDLLKVFKIFKKENRKIKLVLAGWGAKRYIDLNKNLVSDNVIVIDSPNDSDLAFLMRYVDFAVQLRKHSLGESSGVVPMLLELGKTVLVSRIGSFEEFGNEVVFCSGTDNESLKRDILSMLSFSKYPSTEAMNKFVSEHSISRFSSTLHELFLK